MKRFWKYLLWTLVILLLVVAVVLYIVPYYLKQREIQAAQADLALLSIQSTPSPSLKNGIDALWLLEFRTKNDADRADLMKRFGSDIQSNNNQDILKQNQELQGRRLIVPEYDDKSLDCGTTAQECLAEVRADLPKSKAVVEKYAELLANVDRLADYDIFVSRDWPNDDYGIANKPLPKLQFVTYGRKPAALDWAEGREAEAWKRVCRNIKTGRSMLNNDPELIYAMIGNAVIRRNTDLAAQMLYEKPEWANRLPAECDGMFDVLPAEEQNICLIAQEEFRLSANSLRRWEFEQQRLWFLQKWYMNVNGFYELLTLMNGEIQYANIMLSLLLRPNVDAEHTLAHISPYFAAYCKPEKMAILKNDTKAKWMPPEDMNQTFAKKWACMGNSVGCITYAITLPAYESNVHRLQDTAMQQRGFQAALELYRLPAGKRRAALESVLAKHSSPSRRLRWNEEQKALDFEIYQQNASPLPLKLNLEN